MKKTILISLPVIILFVGYLIFRPLPAPEIKNIHSTGENIICFGDSLTYGTGASTEMDYPSQLSEMISEPHAHVGKGSDRPDQGQDDGLKP